MKILELRFKNLNSLYGEWVIDFTSPEYVSNGIFALTGPTGAGKSTILDAICLGLYGATPRLGKITKSANEIMSRQTGECYAEVLFESQAGRFRCHWEQRRSRKKADGNLQEQEHQIVDAITGKPIETKKSLVAGVIEEKTGMDFDRFTRSALLAQGSFDTFLKADVEQKSKILEQITGTEIYSEISRRAHERLSLEREALKLLQAETAGIIVLEPEEEAALRQDLAAKEKLETDLAAQTAAIGKAMAWLTDIENLTSEVNNLLGEETKVKAEIEAFRPDRDTLGRAVKAAALDGIYATIEALRKQQHDDQAAFQKEKAAIPELEAGANAQAGVLKAAERRTGTDKANLQAAMPLIMKIRTLDQTIADQAKSISENTARYEKDEKAIKTNEQIRTIKQEDRAAAENTLKEAEQYLEEHARDAWLVGGLAGVEEQLKNLSHNQKELKQKKNALQEADAAVEEAAKKLRDAKAECTSRKQAVKDAAKKLQDGNADLDKLLAGKLLREYRAEQNALLKELAYIRVIGEFEDHRAKLEDGKPCPLCGSIGHPFAEGNIPVPDDIDNRLAHLADLITKAEQQENVVKTLKDAETATHQKLNDGEKLENDADNAAKTVVKIQAELNGVMNTLQTDFDELKQAVLKKLTPLGILEIAEAKVSSLLKSLKSRLTAWQERIEEKNKVNADIASIDNEITRLNAVIETQISALTEKGETLERLTQEQTAKSNERKSLYGDKTPDDEERKLNLAIATAEHAEKDAATRDNELKLNLAAAKNLIVSLNNTIMKREPELNDKEAEFLGAAKAAGFMEEKLYLAAVLPNEKREALAARAKKLDDAQTELNSKRNDRQTRLNAETAKNVTDKTLQELKPQFEEYEASGKELREAIGGLGRALNDNEAAKERIRNKQSAIEAQRSECLRWERLHCLIGSADGKKFRNFAQGLTFEIMVSHANRQLKKMSDRYLLVRDEQQPLELNVVDDYQGGEIRSIKNLSGGESFIVSLTLALGLSKMASKKVRVDSLFLDEGFGTLDDDALEIALETLSGLHQDGKLIGVISHVSAFKERIGTRLSITPISGGRSSLNGPGCTYVAKDRESVAL